MSTNSKPRQRPGDVDRRQAKVDVDRMWRTGAPVSTIARVTSLSEDQVLKQIWSGREISHKRQKTLRLKRYLDEIRRPIA